MAYVIDLLRDAFGHLKVIAPSEALDASDVQTGIAVLNAMMARIEANGTALGWSPVTNPADVLPAPDEALEPLGFILATRLRPKYGLPIDPDVIQGASEGMALLRRDQVRATPIQWERAGTYYDIVSDSYL